MRSICADTPARPGSLVSLCFLFFRCAPPLERRDADGRGRVLDRDGEADADKYMLFGGVEDRGDDADDLSVGGHQRTARAARIGRRVELDEIDHVVRAV